MASIVQLKRSALSGKVPGTGSLNLGELAVNTYDGKIYFKKSGSIETVESVLTTNSVVTGSIRLEGTGSFGSLKVNDTLTINHGEAIISGSALVTSNLTILGAVNARQFNISVISSSVLFESGSSRFGNTFDDTHQFTGSVNVTGSLYLNGVAVGASSNSGSFTGSFTGSFSGDGSGLRGVVSDDIPRDGWDYDSNSSASINDFNNVSDKYFIDFEQSQSTAVGTPVGFKGFLTNVSGSTQILPTLDGIDFVVGNNVVASIGVGGIIATAPAGTRSGSSQLTSSYDGRYVISGSITQTTWDNIASKPSGIVSGSSQIVGILSSLNTFTSSQYISNSYFATTGSNSFIGNQNISGTIFLTGSIIPATDNTYDLGSSTKSFRHLYVSSGSIYINGAKVLSSTAQELQFTTDAGQSIKILEAGSDTITLQSADGNITLASSGNGDVVLDPTTGVIGLKGTTTLYAGNKIVSSDGNAIQFGNDLGITGSITTTGNINGINLTTFSSSVASTLSNQNSATSSYETKGRGIVSGSSQITFSGISSLPSGIVSGSTQTIANLPTGVISGSIQVLGGTGIISSSAQLNNTTITNLSVTNLTVVNETASVLFSSGSNRFGDFGDDVHDFTGSVKISGSITTIGVSAATSFNGIINATNGVVSGSSQITPLLPTGIVSGSAQTIINLPTGTVSGSSQVVGILSSLNTYTGSNDTTNTAQNTRLTTIESVTGSYETKGRGIVSGSSQITFSGISSLPTLVSGSSQITLSSTTGYGSVLNQAVLTTSSPTFASITSNGNINIPGTNKIVFNNEPLSWFLQARTTSSTANLGSGLKNLIYNGGGANEGIAFSGVDTGAASMEVRNDGRVWIKENLIVGGTLTENSSIRYKENVETIKYGLDKVLQMRGVTYDKKDNGVKEMGVIAEEIYEVLPEVVLKNEEGEIDSVSYGRITAVLIEAIKDLKKEIEELKANK